MITGVTVTPPLPPPPPLELTVSDMVILWDRLPLTPEIVTFVVPVAAPVDAVNVTVLLVVVEAGEKAAVTPAGRPLALSVTEPLNPPDGATVIVLVAELPCRTDTAG